MESGYFWSENVLTQKPHQIQFAIWVETRYGKEKQIEREFEQTKKETGKKSGRNKVWKTTQILNRMACSRIYYLIVRTKQKTEIFNEKKVNGLFMFVCV